MLLPVFHRGDSRLQSEGHPAGIRLSSWEWQLPALAPGKKAQRGAREFRAYRSKSDRRDGIGQFSDADCVTACLIMRNLGPAGKWETPCMVRCMLRRVGRPRPEPRNFAPSIPG